MSDVFGRDDQGLNVLPFPVQVPVIGSETPILDPPAEMSDENNDKAADMLADQLSSVPVELRVHLLDDLANKQPKLAETVKGKLTPPRNYFYVTGTAGKRFGGPSEMLDGVMSIPLDISPISAFKQWAIKTHPVVPTDVVLLNWTLIDKREFLHLKDQVSLQIELDDVAESTTNRIWGNPL